MKKSLKKAGFTLIELIIAVSIIASVVGIFLANYYGSEPQSQLINATSALMRDLRLAQTRGVANLSYGSDIPSGWGIYLTASSTSYTLFADVDGDKVYDNPSESLVVKGAREINLPPGVTISAIDLESPITIIFYNYYDLLRTAIVRSSPGVLAPVEITLTEENTEASKHVYVSPFGLIYSDL
ncbi:MAG: prepilin-type N-terminal cleavage/methylation domain-containing protein [Candidatus Falkowbacteria bacterium]